MGRRKLLPPPFLTQTQTLSPAPGTGETYNESRRVRPQIKEDLAENIKHHNAPMVIPISRETIPSHQGSENPTDQNQKQTQHSKEHSLNKLRSHSLDQEYQRHAAGQSTNRHYNGGMPRVAEEKIIDCWRRVVVSTLGEIRAWMWNVCARTVPDLLDCGGGAHSKTVEGEIEDAPCDCCSGEMEPVLACAEPFSEAGSPDLDLGVGEVLGSGL